MRSLLKTLPLASADDWGIGTRLKAAPHKRLLSPTVTACSANFALVSSNVPSLTALTPHSLYMLPDIPHNSSSQDSLTSTTIALLLVSF